MLKPITITPIALEEVRNILKNKGIPDGYGLRIGVKGGGCGVAFKLGFDHEKEGDLSYYQEDVQILIQKSESMFLIGKQIDFYNESDGKGFVFQNEDVTPQ